MKKVIDGYIAKELHDKIMSDLNSQWRESVNKLVTELKGKYSDPLTIRHVTIHKDEDHQLVSEWRKENEGKKPHEKTDFYRKR